jgi:hypothetical protein
MPTFGDNLTSLSWWLSVVFVGIAINLVSAYLKKHLDRQLGSVSRLWRVRSEKRSEETRSLIQALHSDPHKALVFSMQQANKGIQAVFMTIFGMSSWAIALVFGFVIKDSNPNVFFILAILFFTFSGCVFAFVGVLSWQESMDMGEKLKKSIEVRD